MRAHANVDAVLVSGESYDFDPADYPKVTFLTWANLHPAVRHQYEHYIDVTSGLPAFPEQALRDAVIGYVQRNTPKTIRRVPTSG